MRLLCAFILCQRKRKRHWVVRRARPFVLRFHVENHFILGGRRPRVSKHHSDCVRGEICFKEIVSNTRFDLNCSSFHAFSLWVFNYLQISIYIYSVFVYCFCLSILFVLLFIVKSVFCSLCFITKINCCNISNNLKANLIYSCDLRWKEFYVCWNTLIGNYLYTGQNLKTGFEIWGFFVYR